MDLDVSRADFLKAQFLALPLALRLAPAFAIGFRTGAALSVIGQPRMPQLEGPYSSVGVRLVEVPGGCRVKVFYPTEPAQGLNDAPYCTDGRKTSDGMAGLVGFRQTGLSFLLAHLADAKSGCLLDGPPTSVDGKKLPLLVYSHGFGGNMDMATYFMRQIASFGIVVAALEHRDGTSSHTVLADGTEQDFAPGRMSTAEQLQQRATEMLAAMAPGVLGEDLPIDSANIYLGGHSFGGPAALIAAAQAANSRLVPKPKGLVLHDPALGGGAAKAVYKSLGESWNIGIPLVSFTSDEYDRGGVQCGTTYHVDGCFHGNFVDAALWAPLWVMRPLSLLIPAAGPGDPAALHVLLARAAAKFMQNPSEESRWLGKDEPVLQPRRYADYKV